MNRETQDSTWAKSDRESRRILPAVDEYSLQTDALWSGNQDQPPTRRGRPRVGGEVRAGESQIVRGRISDAEFVAFKQLEVATGKTQARLVREAVQMLLGRHRVVSDYEEEAAIEQAEPL